MAIQVGTVDGLVNISQSPIKCFVDAIDAFSIEGIKFAKINDVSFGTAFQRFVEPVYTKLSLNFDKNSILSPAITKSGNEQSPARVTYCKKMGLLTVDEPNNIFKLTPLGSLIKDNEISIKEYAFILLTKMGVFVNGRLVDNLFCLIAKYFKNHATISDDELKSYIIEQYKDSSISKTRFDIIVGALCASGLVTKVNNVYILSSTQDAKIFEETLAYQEKLFNAFLDNDPNYSEFVGNLQSGIFSVLTTSNIDIFSVKFPNLIKFAKSPERTTIVDKSIFHDVESSIIQSYLTAIRTKPFLLLAGISGTGKSRIVRKLAQATLTEELHKTYNPTYSGEFANDRWTLHSPANFELIQVKPNWHNSMDVVGFKSNIGSDGAHYEFTPFVDFIIRAWRHLDVPFFLCLDEMNLAPVEEYFAEFLSAIESRSFNEAGEFETDPIIKPFDEFGPEVSGKMCGHVMNLYGDDDKHLEDHFRNKGLTLPPNLIVMGTVNMDETTFSFSRKVLDRAMSIEMNEVNYDDFLQGKTEDDVPELQKLNTLLVDRPIKSNEVKDDIDAMAVMDYLKSVNRILDGTPFKLGYRAANEALLYVAAAKQFGSENLAAALDEFTLMKILSRIEGDETKLKVADMNKQEKPELGEDLFPHLQDLFNRAFLGVDDCKSLAKLKNMETILERDHFVSFWG